MDDTNFVVDVGADFYIDDVDDTDESSHGDGANIPSNKAYGDIMVEKCPEQDDIDDFAYKNYIGAKVIMGVTGEGPRQATVRHRVEYLDET